MLLSLSIPKVMLDVNLVLLVFTDVLEKKLINLVQKLKSLTQKSRIQVQELIDSSTEVEKKLTSMDKALNNHNDNFDVYLKKKSGKFFFFFFAFKNR